MPKSTRISVTKNVQHCLVLIKKAMKKVTDEEAKKDAAAAIKYLEKTFAGEAQELRGEGCPPPKRVAPPV